jgi:hypothetical protein
LLRKKLYENMRFKENDMTTAIKLEHENAAPNAAQYVAALFRNEPVFAGVALLMLFAMVPTLAAMAIDVRMHNGINIWDKPLKFEVALFVYVATLAWYAGWLPRQFLESRMYRGFSLVVAMAIMLEMAWIAGAAANGTGSHFNVTHPLMAAIYGLMGLLAVTLTSASLVYGIVFLRDRDSHLDPTIRLSLGLGLILTFITTVIVAGYMSQGNGHWVGGNLSDAEGSLLMGWARDGGDLRVAHFFATHALHFIPAAGYLASKTLAPAQARLAVYGASAAFTALIAFTFFQALAGRPFLPFL